MAKKKEAKFAGWASQHKLEELQEQADRSNRLIAAYANYCHDLQYYIKTLENVIADVCLATIITPEALERCREVIRNHPVPRPFEVKEKEENPDGV